MTWLIFVFAFGIAAGVGLFEMGIRPLKAASWRCRLLELLLPPLFLMRPRLAEEVAHHRKQGKEQHSHEGRSVTGMVLAFSLISFTIFRFATVRDLMHVQRTAYLPVAMFKIPEKAEPFFFVFWYIAFAVLVGASFRYRPAGSKRMASKLFVPEVLALFSLLIADCLLVVLCDYDQNEVGDPTLAVDLPINTSLDWDAWFRTLASDILDDLPRLWFMLNLSLLISITIAGHISPPTGTTAGVIFDVMWSIFVSQCVAMMLQRTATRTKVVLDLLKHSCCLAVLCALSVLFCTHSLAMSLAIVFRQHEHDHKVPSIRMVLHEVLHERTGARLGKVVVFLGALYIVNSSLEPGMIENPHEELLIAALDLAALLVAADVFLYAKRGRSHSSWEATLICVVGSLGSFAWWSELCKPTHEGGLLVAALGKGALPEEGGMQRAVVIIIAVVTHIMLSALFADVFRRKLEPTVNQCLFFTFWAITMLFMGAKLEHHSAVHLMRHHRGVLRVWEVLEHLGEFGICEFGLISTMAWITYLAQNAARWWGPDATRHVEIIITKHSSLGSLAEPLLQPCMLT
eukprot:CAMPEP_0171126274 /NCGR_PEP_ID=MMETSP0766_2-20121228/112983_1 /TAXON_ID=439317 /ORGANISM="Gambierdiscus australes, Strain CAWD 149" /LENGTH=570 /DNA_ID=CAMNT_0011589301 /DNA_START=1 /DNA_END=1713 /DNA_ORIENTATION=-